MRNIRIEVDENPLTDEVIMDIEGAFFMIDNVSNQTSIKIWLPHEKANQLTTLLGFASEDMQRAKDDKASEELREMKPVELEGRLE